MPSSGLHQLVTTGSQGALHVTYTCLSLLTIDALQGENLIPAGPQGLAFSRTPTEVLAIVYLGNASQPGGFFPNGVNGVIGGH